ncbi:MAG: UDP-phosphate galactose phosphotransferase [Gammaproteobacteria bacterium]|nr:MAG: UDP-phosphate galactose phosphotransferase [Gammaproteobacteria bacterium]
MRNPPSLSFLAGVTHRKARIKKYALISSDLISLALVFLLGWAGSVGLRMHFFPELPNPRLIPDTLSQALVFIVPSLIIISLSWSRGHYTRFKTFWDEQRDIIHIVLYAAATDLAFLFVIKSHFSRIWLAMSFLLVLLLLPLGRVVAKRIMMKMGLWFTPTVVVGVGLTALDAAETVESDKMMGHKVIGLIDPSQTRYTNGRLAQLSGYPVFPMNESPARMHQKLGYPYVVIALDDSEEYVRLSDVVSEWISECCNAMVVPPLQGLPLYGTEVAHVFRRDTLLLRLQNNLSRQFPRIIKRTFDLLAAPLLLLLASPLFLYLIVRIRQDGGPAFFAHERIGRYGKPFQCYKFRSMRPDAGEVLQHLLENDETARAEWELDQKLKDDPRITPIGNFLRKTSLDELPQLWNVLKGDMSLVGPRPIVRDELEKYGFDQHYYLDTWPGMTGLWQTSGRNNTSYRERVCLDTWYVRNWSLWYDIVILMKTLPAVFSRQGSY